MDTKTKRRTPPGEPAYHRLTDEKRTIIETLRKEGRSLSYIAERIGCDKSTVSKEIKRNKGKRGYRHKKAQGLARSRVAAKAAKRRKFTPEMWDYAITRLRDDGWTFEQSCGRARRDGVPMVCKETLYKEYCRGQRLVMQGKSKEDLPPLPKRRKQRKTRDRNAKKYRNAGRGKIPGRLDIDERPKAVESRARVATKEATVVAAAIIGMLGAVPKSMLKSLTFDNGKEFAEFCQLEQALGLKVYFAKPYHSWERGTNENRNGIVRRVLPKGRSFEDILNAELERIDHLLNDRPMKCLDWRTPREAHNALLRRHALADAA